MTFPCFLPMLTLYSLELYTFQPLVCLTFFFLSFKALHFLTAVLLVSFWCKGAMVFGKMIFKENFNWIFWNQKIKLKHSIKKKKNKKVYLRVFTHSCQYNCSSCPSGSWKEANLRRKLQKVVKILGKVRDNEKIFLRDQKICQTQTKIRDIDREFIIYQQIFAG